MRTNRATDESPFYFFFTPLVLGAFLLSLAGCSRGETGKVVPKPPGPVTAAAAVEKNVPETLKAIGTVEAYNTVSVRARIGGALIKVAFAEGQDVKEGDLLFAIDPRPYQAALESALAALARDRAQLENAEAQVSRYTALMKEKYMTRQQYYHVI